MRCQTAGYTANGTAHPPQGDIAPNIRFSRRSLLPRPHQAHSRRHRPKRTGQPCQHAGGKHPNGATTIRNRPAGLRPHYQRGPAYRQRRASEQPQHSAPAATNRLGIKLHEQPCPKRPEFVQRRRQQRSAPTYRHGEQTGRRRMVNPCRQQKRMPPLHLPRHPVPGNQQQRYQQIRAPIGCIAQPCLRRQTRQCPSWPVASPNAHRSQHRSPGATPRPSHGNRRHATRLPASISVPPNRNAAGCAGRSKPSNHSQPTPANGRA